MSSQTEIFRRRVRDCLGAPPPSAPHDVSIAEAVACLAETRASGLVLLDGDRRPAGLLTEADITRRVALQADPAAPVHAVMTAPVVCVEAAEYLYRAIARMRNNGLRHLPVTDGDGRLCGMLHLQDALASVSEGLVARIDRLAGGTDDVATLRLVKAAQAGIAAELLADSVPVGDVQGLISHVNNDLYRRVSRALLADSPTPPPADFAVIVMGSGGRGENFLTPDQDNGLVIADYPDADHDRIDAWFVAFAEKLTARMDAIGLPFCDGYVMATNPLWRKTQTQWRDQISGWLRRANASAVLLADIFFDFRTAAGNAALADPVRDLITTEMPRNRRFLGDMLRHHAHFRSALGFLGRFRIGAVGSAQAGRINLKYHGVQPVVAAARLLALREGIAETSTAARIEALAARGALAGAERDDIVLAFATVSDVLLRAQIADAEAGLPITNFVAPGALSRRRRRALRDACRIVDGFSDGVRAEISGQVI